MADLPPATGIILGSTVEDIVGTAWLLGHDLKSPVALIISAMEVIIATTEDDEHMASIMPLLRGALAAANRQHNMVGDMLDLARLETANYELERSQTDVAAIIRDTIATEDYAISTKKLKLELEIPDSPLMANVDAYLVGRVVNALVDNAVKFTVRDDVLNVRVQRVADNIEISFTDNGRAIFPDFEQQIVERAPQWDKRQAGSRTSVGMGLPFSNAVARAHGGSFTAKTDPTTKKTSFTITLPVEPPQQQSETKNG
ncbi:MAG: HAMP domain-containing sensor histidine kinase [Chloroflexota bacterium]